MCSIPDSQIDKIVAEALGVPPHLQNTSGDYLSLREALRLAGCELTDVDIRYAAERGIRDYVGRDASFVRRRLKEALPEYS